LNEQLNSRLADVCRSDDDMPRARCRATRTQPELDAAKASAEQRSNAKLVPAPGNPVADHSVRVGREST